MSRCPYLDYESNSFFGNSSDKYICKECGRQVDVDDSRVKYTCNAEYGDNYKECPIYNNH